MKVYVTKYALTRGIVEYEAKDCGDGMISIPGSYHYFHGQEWHHSYEEAADRAEEMRKKKIASVKKSLSKLEKMKF